MSTPVQPLRQAEIPPLEPGDRLTRPEFERRYRAMSQIKKAELIEGVVHMPSPVRFRHHGNPHASLVSWLVTYSATTPGTGAGDNATARLDFDNEPQPDALLMILPNFGGQATVSADDYIEGAPELVGEVAASSVSIDLHDKLRVYRRAGVREYIVWRVQDRALDWFALQDGDYQLLSADADGMLKSQTFPGLWLDAAALLRGDMIQVLDALRLGLASPQHARFVGQLQANELKR